MGERRRELLILLSGDIACFVASLWFMLLVRYFELPSKTNLDAHLQPFLILTGIFIFVFYIAGLYDKHTLFLKSLLFSRILNTQLINMLLAALVFIIVPFGIAPKVNLVLYTIISIALIAWWRMRLFHHFAPKEKHRAILVANGEEAIELADEVNNNDRYNYSFVRIIDASSASVENFPQKLMSLIEKEGIKTIVADPHSPYLEPVIPILFEKAFLNYEFSFLDFYQVYEDTFDRVPLSSLRYDWFLAHVSHQKSLVYEVGKRIIDITGSLILGVILLFILPFVYIANQVEGRGVKLFMTQNRFGQYNKPVKVFKLQTMTSNDATSATWTDEDAKKGNEVTKTGSIIRRTSLDEMPQIWNILKGEMSLIGPRNDIEGLGKRLAEEIPYYNMRNFVRPGVSGWAQTHQHYMPGNISPQSIEESRVRLSYDLYYVKNRSLVLDIEIALRTVKTLLSRFGIILNKRR